LSIIYDYSSVFRSPQIYQDPSTEKFMYRDLGSAGGSFVRIHPGSRKGLHPGVIILIGKHQFTVSSIDTAKKTKRGPSSSQAKGLADSAAADSKSSRAYVAPTDASLQDKADDGGQSEMMLAKMVSEAEAFINAIESISMQEEGSRAAALARYFMIDCIKCFLILLCFLLYVCYTHGAYPPL
jgi:pSer/pThr/pTyr-binding forkhead associated (FHA) protein